MGDFLNHIFVSGAPKYPVAYDSFRLMCAAVYSCGWSKQQYSTEQWVQTAADSENTHPRIFAHDGLTGHRQGHVTYDNNSSVTGVNS